MVSISWRIGAASALALVLTSIGPASALAQDDGAGSVVVTTQMLGSIVMELVEDTAAVSVLMPRGADPHSWEPSARDVERINEADLVVSNGLDLEEGLVVILEAAAADGVRWFEAADHVALRGLADGEGGHDDLDALDAAGPDEADEHDHGAADPHFWTDPLAMADVVVALTPVLAEAGVDMSSSADAFVAELEALDEEVRGILASVPAEDRALVTGHRSLGYFAERYGFEQIGTVIPSLSTGAEPSPRDLARLIADIRAHEVSVVFADVGTPQAVARAVAADAGAVLVELSSELPEEGTYAAFMRELATTIAGALGPEGR